jgi:hypothetical protein
MESGGGRLGDLNAIQELGREVDTAADIARLKTIFYRVEEIARQYPNDGEMNAAAEMLRARIRERVTTVTSGPRPAVVPQPAPDLPPHPGAVPRPPAAPTQPPQAAFVTGPAPVPSAPPPARDLPPAAPSPLAPPRPIPDVPPAAVPPLGTAAFSASYNPGAPAQPPPTPPPQSTSFNWKLPVIGGGLIGLLLFGGVIFISKKKPFTKQQTKQTTTQTAALFPVEVKTEPPGAQIAVDGQPRCTSDCSVDLAPGQHQVSAIMLGFENEAAPVAVASAPASLRLKLRPLPPSLRITSNLQGWRVRLDDGPPAELQEGQWSLDRAPAGKHILHVYGPNGEVRVAVEIPEASGNAPQVQALSARNVFALVLAGGGDKASLRSSEPISVQVEGQAPIQLKQAPAEIAAVAPGEHPVLIGDGKDQRKLLMSFSPATTVTIHLLQNTTTGALVVLTGEDGVSVTINGKARKQLTQKGQLRIYNLEPGTYTVAVAKSGFESVTEQKVAVKRGEETRADFKLVPLPKVASLHIRGAQPGATVLFGGSQVGTVQPDGTFSMNSVTPGDHTIELRHPQFSPKHLTRHFAAGQTIELSGADVALVKALATLSFPSIVPPEAEVSVKRSGDANATVLDRGKTSLQLPEGTYTISARAPGYDPITKEIQLTAGGSRSFGIELVKVKAAVVATGMDAWDHPADWTQEDQWHVHGAQAAPVLFRPTPTEGTFTFTVTLLRGRGTFANHPIRWMLDYRGPGDFVLYELDKKNFTRRQYRSGSERENLQVKHGLDKQNQYALRVKVEGGAITTRILRGGSFDLLDEFREPGRNFGAGRFGFQIRDKDVLGLSNFAFSPSR